MCDVLALISDEKISRLSGIIHITDYQCIETINTSEFKFNKRN